MIRLTLAGSSLYLVLMINRLNHPIHGDRTKGEGKGFCCYSCDVYGVNHYLSNKTNYQQNPE